MQITLRAQPAGHFSAERSILAAHLVAEARRLHPQDIRWHFDIKTEVSLPDTSTRTLIRQCTASP